MIRPMLVATFVSLSFSTFVTTGAGAQIGGLIKRKAAEAVKGDEKKDTPAATAAVTLPSGVTEMTGPILDGLIAGLRTEIRLRNEFSAELARVPTKEQYNQCLAKLAASRELQKIQMSLADLPDNATEAQTTAAMKKMNDDMAALQKKTCPVNPDDFGENRKQQRLLEIEARAAESMKAKGAVPRDDHEALGGPLDQDGSEDMEVLAPQQKEAEDQKLYRELKERIVPLCKELAKTPAQSLYANGVKVPGAGTVYWVYTATEVKAAQSRCDEIMKLFEELEKKFGPT